jgi:hypothetical protein
MTAINDIPIELFQCILEYTFKYNYCYLRDNLVILSDIMAVNKKWADRCANIMRALIAYQDCPPNYRYKYYSHKEQIIHAICDQYSKDSVIIFLSKLPQKNILDAVKSTLVNPSGYYDEYHHLIFVCDTFKICPKIYYGDNAYQNVYQLKMSKICVCDICVSNSKKYKIKKMFF